MFIQKVYVNYINETAIIKVDENNYKVEAKKFSLVFLWYILMTF